MNSRERFNAVASFKSFDRLPVIEWANWWDKTLERWHAEGLPPSLTDSYEIARHFGLDVCWRYWTPLSSAPLPRPLSAHDESLITDEASYERVLPLLFPKEPERIADRASLAKIAKAQREDGELFWLTFEGFFWLPRRLMGIERHLYAFYDQPELMLRLNEELANYYVRAVDALCELCQPDFMTFAEDLSYNNGPMLSKEHFDKFLLPFYKRVVPLLKERGVKVFADSDGDVAEAVGWFEEAGFDGVLPLERQAGCDLASLRAAHPRTLFLGAFDKTVMHRGEEALRAEFERLLPVAKGGGFVMSCDHQTPPEASYEDYKLYVKLFKEYAVKAGAGA